LKKSNSQKLKITVLDGYTLNPGDLSWAAIEQLGETEIFDRTPSNLTIERSVHSDVLVVNKHVIDEDVIAKLPKLKCICVSATGYNNVDIKAAAKRNIPVCNVTGYGSAAVAQHVFALILELHNHVENYNKSVKNEDWSNAPDFTYYRSPIVGLAGKILGIYGLGKIGQKVADIALAFDMKVMATHKHPVRDARLGVQFVSLETLFSESDIVTLHAPLNAENEQIVNAHLFKKMKPSAFLINTGRGGLINESDLKTALENQWLAGVGLDVLQKEPPPANHSLFGIKNCIITPHLAWATVEARSNLLQLTANNISAFLEGNPINVVNDPMNNS
jgi:glycerate dehydrogenase